MKTKAEILIERAGLFTALIFMIVMLLNCMVQDNKCYPDPIPGLCETTWDCDENQKCCQNWICEFAVTQPHASENMLCECHTFESYAICAQACVVNEFNWACFDCEDTLSCWPCLDGMCMRTE